MDHLFPYTTFWALVCFDGPEDILKGENLDLGPSNDMSFLGSIKEHEVVKNEQNWSGPSKDMSPNFCVRLDDRNFFNKNHENITLNTISKVKDFTYQRANNINTIKSLCKSDPKLFYHIISRGFPSLFLPFAPVDPQRTVSAWVIIKWKSADFPLLPICRQH